MFKVRSIVFVACIFSVLTATAQHRERAVSFAITNQHSAYPFAAFARLFSKEFHPGIEAGYSFNWKTAPKHDWYQTIRAGYFYHRFVQHAIPLYTQLGYRYKLQQRFGFSAALGAGYLHSVPATAVLKRNDDGMYENAKGIGRGQALLNFTLGAHYQLTQNGKNDPAVFIEYGQEIQTPFIRSYVPLLPYNHLAVGVSVPLKSKN